MDSVTQFVLGAAVGEAVLRTSASKPGQDTMRWKAVLLGGLVGTLPDLDVVTRLWLDGPERLAAHRGVTHSLFFCTLVTPILAYFFRAWFTRAEISWPRWLAFVWLGLNTHWMLDSFTMYGTQVFRPFSSLPINGASIFIIDPVYTFTLIAGLCVSLWASRGGREIDSRGVKLGLLLSCCYLMLTVTSKLLVMQRFDQAWEASGRPTPVARITAPTPFNCVLWYCYIDTGDDIWVGDSSLLDSAERQIPWRRIPKNKELFPGFGEGRADKVLLWFSRGFYTLTVIDETPVFIDLRFGRLKSWLVPQSPTDDDYVFRFFLQAEKTEFESTGPFENFFLNRPEGGRLSSFPWDIFWRRVRGEDVPISTERSDREPTALP